MDQYLEKLEVFYDEKMKYLTKKDKFIKCQTCENERKFHESKDELILSCGSDKDDKCGPQIKIRLPKYIHYVNKIDALKETLNDEYNWDILQKYLDVSEEAKKSEENREKINEEIERIEKLYFEKNMALKKEQIQVFYDGRINKTKECKEIIHKLNDNDDEEQKASLRKEYILLVREINNKYEQIQELMKDINPFLTEQEPEVTILHNTHEYKKDKKGKKEKEREKIEIEQKDTIGQIVKEIIACNGYKTKDELLKLWGTTGKAGDINLKPLYSLVKEELVKNEKEWRKKEDPAVVQASIQRYISGYKNFDEHLNDKDCNNQFKVGMKVSWIYKEKKKMGVIKRLEGKGALIRDERGKEKVRQLNKLMIED